MKRILKALLSRISTAIHRPSLRDCARMEYHRIHLESLARNHIVPRFPRNYSHSKRTHVPFGLELVRRVSINHPRIKSTRNFLLRCESDPDQL